MYDSSDYSSQLQETVVPLVRAGGVNVSLLQITGCLLTEPVHLSYLLRIHTELRTTTDSLCYAQSGTSYHHSIRRNGIQGPNPTARAKSQHSFDIVPSREHYSRGGQRSQSSRNRWH